MDAGSPEALVTLGNLRCHRVTQKHGSENKVAGTKSFYGEWMHHKFGSLGTLTIEM